jgi:23S rRNA-/tRNA-specific pseudouridylate synthase
MTGKPVTRVSLTLPLGRSAPCAALPTPRGAEAYLAIDKPAGVAVHGPHGLLGPLRKEFGDNLALVHRLDKETSGVLLLAKTPEALRAAQNAWPTSVTKTYRAVTRGVPSPPEGVVTEKLLEHRTGKPELLKRALKAAYGPARAGHLLSGRRVGAIPGIPPPGRTAVHPAGRGAKTAYRVLEDRGTTALVELTPETGRMHQLRVHLAHLGTPLLGDTLYDASRTPETPAPLLHAARLVWSDPPDATGGAWTWEAPLPGAGRVGP